MKILFIIPARKGSKRLVGKNKMHFNGKPLVSHSIDFAIKAASKEDVICITSDDDEILEIAKIKSVDLIIKRPPQLASDDASSFDVILHACNFAQVGNWEFDTVVLLQPTTPFRSIKDFEKMRQQFIENGMSALASIAVKGEIKNCVVYDPRSMKVSVSNIGKRGYLNGSLYFYDYSSLLRQNKTLTFGDMGYYLMSEKNSIDIDTMDDWNLAINYL